MKYKWVVFLKKKKYTAKLILWKCYHVLYGYSMTKFSIKWLSIFYYQVWEQKSNSQKQKYDMKVNFTIHQQMHLQSWALFINQSFPFPTQTFFSVSSFSIGLRWQWINSSPHSWFRAWNYNAIWDNYCSS